jgi:hypothetical protein
MKDEFEFNAEDLEFGEFDQDLEDFGEFGELQTSFDDLEEAKEVLVRTAVLSKNNMIALLCVKTADQGGAICRVDPREDRPAVQIYDDPAKAMEWFKKSLSTSRKNGWQVVYDGLPLQG